MNGLGDIEHVTIGGGKNLLCLWPRHGALRVWDRELLAAYIESPCPYRHPQEAARDLSGVWKRGYLRLRRSRDGGASWEDAGKLFEHSLPFERQRRILRLEEYRSRGGPEREAVDLASPDAVMIMGRAWCGEAVRARAPVVFGFRSPDRGQRWETVPSVLWPETTPNLCEFANNVLRLHDGRLLCWLVGTDGIEGAESAGALRPQFHLSEDNGAQWTSYGELSPLPAGGVAVSYPHVVALPAGRWLCFTGCWFAGGSARRGWTALWHSDDEGLNWSEPRRVAAWSHAPFPLRLKDGRLLVVFSRCAPDPTGLYVTWSEDEGRRWSRPAALRTDTLKAGPRGEIDGAYPVAVELPDGRVLAAYCWQHEEEDVPWYGGRSFIGGTFFRLT